MEQAAPEGHGTQRPTFRPHTDHDFDHASPINRPEKWLELRNDESTLGNDSRHDSERSTSSSRYTGPESLSEHRAESGNDPEIVPPSPSAIPLYRHHDRSYSAHSLHSAPESEKGLEKRVDKGERISSTSPCASLLQLSGSQLQQAPPPPPPPFPPNFSSLPPRGRPRDESDSEGASSDVSTPDNLARHRKSPRLPPPPFPAGMGRGTSSLVVPPPPPPRSSPNRPPHPGLKTQPVTRHIAQRGIEDKGSESSSSPERVRRQTRYAESTDSSGDGVDPVSARNARVFPPRFPAAMTRAAPPSKSAAIHNITSWVHQYEHGRAYMGMVSQNAASKAPPPPPFTGLGTAVDDTLSSYTGSTSGDSDVPLADTIEHLWQALKDKRAKVAEVKSEMSRQRRELRALRRKRDDADNALMKLLRPMLVNSRSVLNMSPSLLRDRFWEVQNRWNDYNHREAMYEGQELLLDEEEEALNFMEIRFFSVLAAGRIDHETVLISKDRLNKPAAPFDVPLELRGISAEGPTEELHPHYIMLTSTVGDLQNAKEQHAELRAEREALEADLTIKQATQQLIPRETVKSLNECKEEEKRLVQRVDNLHLQTHKLKELCEKEGVMRKHMSIGMQYFLDPMAAKEEDIDLEDGLPATESLRHPRFPQLMSRPDHILANPFPQTTREALVRANKLPMDDPENREDLRNARKEFAVESLLSGSERQSKSEFVNRWLLQALQTSSLETSRLYDTFTDNSRLVIRNTALWERDVLHYWFRDGTLVEYDVDQDELPSEDRNIDGSVRGTRTPPMSRAESAPQPGMSPISRASDDDSAKTLDGAFRLPETVSVAAEANNTWSGTASPQIMTAALWKQG